MLPTPDTLHVPYDRVYEPAEDSFLMLDTLAAETHFLQPRLAGPAALVVEVGSGSGVVLAFATAHAPHIFGPAARVLTLAVDVNGFACAATGETVRRAVADEKESRPGHYLGAVRADLVSVLRPGQVDVLIFNPPYVPTPEMPRLPDDDAAEPDKDAFARDSHLLELAYAGGLDGMETTDRLLAALPAVLAPQGCAYLILCAQNRPEAVKARIRGWAAGDGGAWQAETVRDSGKQAGWEKLQVVRIWRETGGRLDG